MEDKLVSLVRDVYNAVGWPGVVVLMAIETACIPFPSEVIMPFAGWFLVRSAGLGVWWIFPLALAGALGNLLGSLVAYWIGAKAGRPALQRYGKYLLISSHDLEVADRWFARRGTSVIFFSRLLPVVRTFISLSAGVARMDLIRFSVFTLAGCYLFSLGLTYGGYVLGEHWDALRGVMRPLDIPLLVALVLLMGLYVWRHYRRAWSVSDKLTPPDQGRPILADRPPSVSQRGASGNLEDTVQGRNWKLVGPIRWVLYAGPGGEVLTELVLILGTILFAGGLALFGLGIERWEMGMSATVAGALLWARTYLRSAVRP